MSPAHRILVPIDFSHHARFALDGARAIAGDKATVLVVYVWQPPHELPLLTKAVEAKNITLSDLARKEASKTLRHFLDGTGSELRQRVEVGVPHEVIVTLAASENFDLIVMGAVGAGGNPARVGSVTRRVLDSSPCPVLTLRAPHPPRSSPGPEAGSPI